MATRCAIGILHNGKIIGKYSHYDGYPEYTGDMLKAHYTDPVRIMGMVMLGDQSVLMKEYMPTSDDHSFETPDPDVTVFYNRDRGESGCEARMFDDLNDYFDHYAEAWCDYYYLWDGFKWCCWNSNRKPVPLDVVIEEVA